MANKKRRKDPIETSIEGYITVISGIYSLICLIIDGLYDGLATIFNFICKISRKITQKQREENIISNNKILTKIEENNEKYDELFPVNIRHRGEEYYLSGKVHNVNYLNNTYTCQVKGSKTYDVSITFDKNDLLKSASCTCPYFSKYNLYCKHMYALLYKEKLKDNKEKIYNRIIKTIKSCEHMLNTHKDKIENYSYYQKPLNIIKTDITSDELDDILGSALDSVNSLYEDLKKECDRIEPLETQYKKPNDNVNYAQQIDEIFKDYKEQYEEGEKQRRQIEEEMELFGLEEDEKELVRSGDYEPYQFNTDGELQEEDYYYESDNIK